ncbi:hypothetical protein H0H81_006375 [Sphagnurus paluster]|uniref:F-box domain-containing protein n=1 Tax=Sphagnurus paluster TaxID=117069 RepID=A0A9P7GK29_9AGAR|nr:hypothetical protein H0H81_006375 [Sphagnurus paluster]
MFQPAAEEYIPWSLNDPPYEDPEFDETSKAVASNSFLSESLQVHAQSRLSNAKTHLHLIDEHIARADANLSEIYIRRRQCIAQIELYSTASAPVRKLPADVLVEIFRALDTVEHLLASSLHLASLTTLEIRSRGVRSLNGDLELTALKNMPNLRNVRLITDTQPALKILEDYPGPQITELSLNQVLIIPQQFVSILHLSPNLISASFHVIAESHINNPVPPWKFDHFIPPTPLVHNIQHMDLTYTSLRVGGTYEDFQLRQLVLPQLRHAVLSLRQWEIPGLCAMITNSGLLEQLHLQTSAMTTSELRDLLLGAPHLEELCIARYMSYGVVLPAEILQQMGSGELVPRLKKLECFIDNIDEERHVPWRRAFNLHLDMLEKRRRAVPLASDIADVTFCFWQPEQALMGIPPNQSDWLVQRMERMKREGWKIEVVNESKNSRFISSQYTSLV